MLAKPVLFQLSYAPTGVMPQGPASIGAPDTRVHCNQKREQSGTLERRGSIPALGIGEVKIARYSTWRFTEVPLDRLRKRPECSVLDCHPGVECS